MFQTVFHRQTSRWTIFHWFLLTFLAGSVNAGGFLACNRFVSHVTGFATLAGVDFAYGQAKAGLGMFAVPLFFLLGVMISAYLVDRRVQTGRQPRYPVVMGLVAICLFLVVLGGEWNLFGLFDASLKLKKDFIFLALLCMASGLQNAAITTGTGSTVRTTHLTGPTTDLGIGIIRLYSYPKDSEQAKDLRAQNLMKLGQIMSFFLGSFVGAMLFLRLEYLGFLLPAALALYAAAVARSRARLPIAPQAKSYS